MPVLHAIVLGIVQGLSEFLPISSSGHLAVVPWLFRWNELTSNPDLNRTFDVALHMGTFVGVAFYFRADLAELVGAAWASLRRRSIDSQTERLAWLLLVASIPAAVVGAALDAAFNGQYGPEWLIGVMLIVFGAVLLWADRRPERRPEAEFRTRDAILMGTAQALALQPGVSRSGATMSMGRWLGFDREAAARISFLMSIPIIAGAGLLKGSQVALGGGIPPGFAAAFFWGTLASGVTGFAAVWTLLRLIKHHSLNIFVIYRFIAGAVIIAVSLSR